MNRTIWLGLLALSIALDNASLSNACVLSTTTAEFIPSEHSNLLLVRKISARDDQTGDCLRLGTCKD